MRLPDAERATVEPAKVVSCLLNAGHRDNGGKAGFSESLGFTRADWPALANALRRVGGDHDVALAATSKDGTKYVVDGSITEPGGKTA